MLLKDLFIKPCVVIYFKKLFRHGNRTPHDADIDFQTDG